MYPWLVFLHVLGVFGFLMAHGVSISVAFALRSERNPDHIRTLLNLSSSSLGILQGSILILLLTGIVIGFIGHWWQSGWIWLALGLLIATFAYMYFAGTVYYSQVRKLIGLPRMDDNGQETDPANRVEINTLLGQARPVWLAAIGFGSLAVIAGLMMFKPF